MPAFDRRPKQAALSAVEPPRDPKRDEPLSAHAIAQKEASRRARFEAAHAWVLEHHAATFEKLAK